MTAFFVSKRSGGGTKYKAGENSSASAATGKGRGSRKKKCFFIKALEKSCGRERQRETSIKCTNYSARDSVVAKRGEGEGRIEGGISGKDARGQTHNPPSEGQEKLD